MKKAIINGKFMAESMQGIVRYARELTSALDMLLDSSVEISIAIPPDAKDIPDYKNIKIVKIGKNTGIKWEQTDLRKYVKSQKGSYCINLCNIAPFGVSPGITTIHDIMYKVNPKDYTTFRNRVSRYWHELQYKYICRHEKIILTDSEYSKKQIEQYYPVAKGKIAVIPCGWQHVLRYKENPDWKQIYPDLYEKEYYFSLSTLSKNKNGQWIVEVAKRNPDSVFAIAGKYYETEKVKIPPNVHMLGFISDEDACSLIKHCKAFIHPAFYEGFGLPPLEALALGARVISSNITSLPEVLGDSVYYINPYDANVDLEQLLENSVLPAENTLNHFSWKKSAQKVIILLEKLSDE